MSISRLYVLLWHALQRASILCAAVLAVGSAGFAAERVIVAGDPNGGPFYARIERGVVPATDEWVAIAFYRLPSCVRADFNLLDFFDFANIPAVFFCPLTVHGFEIWENGPGTDEAPMQVRNSGNGAVPVWIVSRADYDKAMPGLTLNELMAMPSLLQGTATFFEDTLHPRGAARQSMIEVLARGTVPDGRSFEFHLVEAAGVLRRVRIVLR
jgi:hypothetical protein